MKYAVIAAHVGTYPVAFMCRVIEVAPSGYYPWCQQPTSKRAQQDESLTVHVRAAFKASRLRTRRIVMLPLRSNPTTSQRSSHHENGGKHRRSS